MVHKLNINAQVESIGINENVAKTSGISAAINRSYVNVFFLMFCRRSIHFLSFQCSTFNFSSRINKQKSE